MDRRTTSCEELRWARLKVEDGDLRCIPRLIFVMDQGHFYPMEITIEGDLSLEMAGVQSKPVCYSRQIGNWSMARRMDDFTGKVAPVNVELLAASLNFEKNSRLLSRVWRCLTGLSVRRMRLFPERRGGEGRVRR